MAALLDVRHVTVRIGGLTALSDVSLTISAGEVVGVIGPNGAGKTTLFNVMCGFVRPSEGELSWAGASLRRHKPSQLASLGIARTLQALGLLPHMTVLDNVLVGANRHATPQPTAPANGIPPVHYLDCDVGGRSRKGPAAASRPQS